MSRETQQTVSRVLNLIMCLSGTQRLPLTTYAQRHGCTERTIRRDIDLIQNLGFDVDWNENNRPFIADELDYKKHTDFSREEWDAIYCTLDATSAEGLIPQILTKLNLTLQKIPLIDNVKKIKLTKIKNLLLEAHRLSCYVELQDYQSASSQSISNKLVAPILIEENNLTAYDSVSGISKNFKIERIGEVVLQPQNIFNPKQFKNSKGPDVFGWSGATEYRLILKLNNYAKKLLTEEFQAAEPFIVELEKNKAYELRTQIQGFEAAGRFVLGLPGMIDVVEPPEFKDYLSQKIRLFSFV
jgi:proteasome accessory factor C